MQKREIPTGLNAKIMSEKAVTDANSMDVLEKR